MEKFIYLQIIWLTAIAIVSRLKALNGLQHILKKLGADNQLLGVARRQERVEAVAVVVVRYALQVGDQVAVLRHVARRVVHVLDAVACIA